MRGLLFASQRPGIPSVHASPIVAFSGAVCNIPLVYPITPQFIDLEYIGGYQCQHYIQERGVSRIH